VLAITGRDHGRGARVLRIDLVQSLVQLRRTGDGQRREKGDDDANANAGARFHASGRFSRCQTLRKFFEPRARARIGLAILGSAGCSALPRTDGARDVSIAVIK
jgi:hypothetical protein